MKDLKKAVEACKTSTQVKKELKRYGKQIMRDDSKEVGCFSIWIDKTTRIYKPTSRSNMVLQGWKPVVMEYSGIPTYFD